MHKTMAMAMAMATVAIMTTTACDPEGSCNVDTDCAFGQMCGVEGVCVYASVGAGPGGLQGPPPEAPGPLEDPMNGMDGGDFSGNASPLFSTTGSFDGTIGPTEVGTAEVVAWGAGSALSLSLVAVGMPSTFLAVQLPVSAFAVPGTTVRHSNMSDTWIQACNYDTAVYDESFPEFVIDVSPPRAAEPGDQIIAEDQPEEVIDVVISVDGEGSIVSGTFTMPML